MGRMTSEPSGPVEHVDVLVVGAGLSGIGAACHLTRRCPSKTVAVLEARDALGGTWDLFRYPGVRSDSDTATLGYAFRPWASTRVLADGASILAYLRETAREHGVDQLVRTGHRVVSASWCSARARWEVECVRAGTGERVRMTCGFLYCCTGYYRYDAGHAPVLPGADGFGGRVVHPQHWPEGLDLTGRRVVVLGSGSTAVTLVPTLARTAAHVTMLQRSPSWVVSVPTHDAVAALLGRVLPARAVQRVVRARNIAVTTGSYRLVRAAPGLARRLLLHTVAAQLPAGTAGHFSPSYDPWDQRVCVAADGDLFCALRDGRASVVTDEVASLTSTGLRLASGAELPADVVVTATGLELLALGGIELRVDGVPVHPADTVVHGGAMLSGVPNLAFVVGYTHASWTLKADLVAERICRLLRAMDARGATTATPPPSPTGAREPLIDFTSTYVRRGAHVLPQQGPRAPWRASQGYLRDVLVMRHGRVDGGGLVLGTALAGDRVPDQAPA